MENNKNDGEGCVTLFAVTTGITAVIVAPYTVIFLICYIAFAIWASKK